jgi:Tfp pilus assembly protein PilV
VTPRCARTARGATLLEVALAMAVMAVCVLGQLGTQIAVARHARAASERERAAFAADAIAEASLGASARAADEWKARVPAIVPHGTVALAGAGGEGVVVIVTWAASRYTLAPVSTPPDTCNGVAVGQDHACISLGFAK